MVDIFEKGKIDLGADMSAIRNLIQREDLENSLNEILRISSEVGTYFLIVGEHGTGKTTLVRNTISKLEKPKVNYSISSFLFDVFTFYFFLIGCCPF